MRRLQPFPKGSNQNVRWRRCMACRGDLPLLRHAPCQHTFWLERISQIMCYQTLCCCIFIVA